MKNIHIPTIEELLKPEEFRIEKLTDGYRIRGVMYRNHVGTYDVGFDLLANATQKEHAIHARNAEPEDYRAASAPLIHAICKTLYKHKDKARSVRALLNELFARNRSLTLSQVVHSAEPDRVTHDFMQKDQKISLTGIIGPTGLIKLNETQASQYCKSILEDDNLEEINNIYNWITGKETFIGRYERIPDNVCFVRPVLMGYPWGKMHFQILTTTEPTEEFPALKIRPAK